MSIGASQAFAAVAHHIHLTGIDYPTAGLVADRSTPLLLARQRFAEQDRAPVATGFIVLDEAATPDPAAEHDERIGQQEFTAVFAMTVRDGAALAGLTR